MEGIGSGKILIRERASITVYFEEIKFLLGFSSFSKLPEFLSISPHLVGSHDMGRCSHGGSRVCCTIFKVVRASSISPHLVGSQKMGICSRVGGGVWPF